MFPRLRRAQVGSSLPAIRDRYCEKAPHPQNALDLFPGEWASRLPPPLEGLNAGQALLFDDGRLRWAIERLGGVAGRRVLELGPLEGGHTYLLDRSGASEIVAIEANPTAYLKCLVAKELLDIRAARFLHGDFVQFLTQTSDRFDFVVASGVLYHLVEPVELIARLGVVTDAVYIWTHYYSTAYFDTRPATAARVVEPGGGERIERAGFPHVRYRHEYGNAVSEGRFFGGAERFSYWVTRDDILCALRHFGFATIDILLDEPTHPHGPAFALLARR